MSETTLKVLEYKALSAGSEEGLTNQVNNWLSADQGWTTVGGVVIAPYGEDYGGGEFLYAQAMIRLSE